MEHKPVPAPVPAELHAAASKAIQRQVAKLTAADGTVYGNLGFSVSVCGDTALVGADYADVGGVRQGAAYVFYRNQGGPDAWGQVAKLTAADGLEYDRLGTSVSVDGDTALVGAYMASAGGGRRGAAYVFNRTQGGPDAWGQVAKLTPADRVPGFFGCSVSVRGDTALVGCFRATVGSNLEQGAAYVFDRHQGGPDAWGQVARLTAADGQENDRFGTSVSADGDTALVGADSADVGGNLVQGAAYVFYRNQGGPGAWGQVAKLTAADGVAQDSFGSSVSVDGDTAVVGAYTADVGGNGGQGAAYLFYRDRGPRGAWVQVAKLTAADGAAEDAFGLSVSVSGDTAIVGSHGATVGGDAWEGAAYTFSRDMGGPDAWGQVAKLTAADGAADDRFGLSVSVDGDTALVGADDADVGGNEDQGAAYVYSPRSGTLHLNKPIMRRRPTLSSAPTRIVWAGRIHDQDHRPVPAATVHGEYIYPDGSVHSKSACTDRLGLVSIGIMVLKAGTYGFCVTDIAKEGYLYDRRANEAPACKSIAVRPFGAGKTPWEEERL